jgi:hypothetical protein
MAATVVIRGSTADSATQKFFLAYDALPEYGIINKQAEDLVVIDWITFVPQASNAVCVLTIVDDGDPTSSSMAGTLYKTAATINGTDTIHIQFPGGMPLKRGAGSATVVSNNLLSRNAVPKADLSWNVTGASFATIYIGLHFERQSNRA